MCFFRYLDWPNDFWHSEQMWILSPLEVREWLAISLYFGVNHPAPLRLSNWKIWNFLVPVQRLGHFYFSIFMVKQTTNYFSLFVSIEDKIDEGIDWAKSILKSLSRRSSIIHDYDNVYEVDEGDDDHSNKQGVVQVDSSWHYESMLSCYLVWMWKDSEDWDRMVARFRSDKNYVFFIGPRSDHSLPMSVTN